MHWGGVDRRKNPEPGINICIYIKIRPKAKSNLASMHEQLRESICLALIPDSQANTVFSLHRLADPGLFPVSCKGPCR